MSDKLLPCYLLVGFLAWGEEDPSGGRQPPEAKHNGFEIVAESVVLAGSRTVAQLEKTIITAADIDPWEIPF